MDSNHRYYRLLHATAEDIDAQVARYEDYKRNANAAWKAHEAEIVPIRREAGKTFIFTIGGLILFALVGVALDVDKTVANWMGGFMGFANIGMLARLAILSRRAARIPFPEIATASGRYAYYFNPNWLTELAPESEALANLNATCEGYSECRQYRDAILALGRGLRQVDANYIGELVAVIERCDTRQAPDWPALLKTAAS